MGGIARDIVRIVILDPLPWKPVVFHIPSAQIGQIGYRERGFGPSGESKATQLFGWMSKNKFWDAVFMFVEGP